MTEAWIDINQYAKKYGISSSTLRRRIRSKAIEHKLQKGKYLLRDTEESLNSAPLFSRTVVAQSAPKTAAHKSNKDLGPLEEENRRLNAKILELETLVKILESDI